MRKTLFALLLAGLMATTAFADSNGTVGTGAVLNTGTTVSLGGPFDHGDIAGDPSNSITTAAFNEAFAANQILIEGDVTGVIPFGTSFFLGEADIIVTDAAGGTVQWATDAGTVPDTTTGPTAFSNTANLANAGGTGTFSFEFIDTFDDGAGADSVSDNVTATLFEIDINQDSVGNFSLSPLGPGGVATSVGEFTVTDTVWDEYAFTLAQAGVVTIETDEDPLGLLSVAGGALDTVDTELGLFDSTGTLIAYDDDGGNGLYSLLSGVSLAAGDYTVGVAAFGSSISAAGVGTFTLGDFDGGTSIGDYSLSVTVAVPEPSALGLLAIAGMIGFTRRRR